MEPVNLAVGTVGAVIFLIGRLGKNSFEVNDLLDLPRVAVDFNHGIFDKLLTPVVHGKQEVVVRQLDGVVMNHGVVGQFGRIGLRWEEAVHVVLVVHATVEVGFLQGVRLGIAGLNLGVNQQVIVGQLLEDVGNGFGRVPANLSAGIQTIGVAETADGKGQSGIAGSQRHLLGFTGLERVLPDGLGGRAGLERVGGPGGRPVLTGKG